MLLCHQRGHPNYHLVEIDPPLRHRKVLQSYERDIECYNIGEIIRITTARRLITCRDMWEKNLRCYWRDIERYIIEQFSSISYRDALNNIHRGMESDIIVVSSILPMNQFLLACHHRGLSNYHLVDIDPSPRHVWQDLRCYERHIEQYHIGLFNPTL